MPLASSRLLASLKAKRASTRTRTSEATEASESGGYPERTSREKWHKEVESAEGVLEYLVTGRSFNGPVSLDSLLRSTWNCLKGSQPDHTVPSTEWDQTLASLIEEHVENHPSRRDVAVIACIRAFSLPVATTQLISLMDLEVGRYLRCISLAGQVNPSVASHQENQLAQVLLQVLSSQVQNFHAFQQLVELLSAGTPLAILPFPIIQNALNASNMQRQLQTQLDGLLQQRRYLSVYRQLSWLYSIPVTSNDNVAAVLGCHFPSWSMFRAWRPNVDRINQWELGRFTDVQRKKLVHAFELDGPDTATGQQQLLMMSQPWCYAHVQVHPQTVDTLKRFVKLLSQAHMVGPMAIDLFIHLCIENVADEKALSAVEFGVDTRDDTYCGKILSLLRGINSQSSPIRQITGLAQALSILKDHETATNICLPVDHLVNRLSSIMGAAQLAFRAQLEKGTGEYIGMLIYDLGSWINQASWIHSYLPPDFLAQMRHFPPQDTLEAIFDQLQDLEEPSNCIGWRTKLYLASTLGGDGSESSTSITVTEIRQEIQFWKHPLDADRKDLARTFAQIRSIDYSLYTSCLDVMLKEDDFFIREMRHQISKRDGQSCMNFVNYLAHRRGLNQLQHDCWLLILACLIQEQGPFFLSRMAESMPADEWIQFVGNLSGLVAPVHAQLLVSGTGLTQEILSWWEVLSRKKPAVQFLLQRLGKQARLKWLYFPSRSDQISDLLDIVKKGQSMSLIHRQITSYLEPDGKNVAVVCNCIKAVGKTSTIGLAVCERIFSRKEKSGEWSDAMLRGLVETWSHSGLLGADVRALDHIKELLKLSATVETYLFSWRSCSEALKLECKSLFNRARELETSRLRLRRRNPQKLAALLQRLGIDDSDGRVGDPSIPELLTDAVERVSDTEYEISFALTGLSELQRQARGISKDSRMLVVRLFTPMKHKFCLRFSPDDDSRRQHVCWPSADNRDLSPYICTARSNLFTYYLSRNLYQLLRSNQSSLQSIHSTISGLITASPATCVVCCGSMPVKLWKPSTCSQNCSVTLRTAPLEVRLHNLLVDPLTIDLLLTCIYAAAADQTNLDLLPGCPVQRNNLAAVIDSFPPLTTLTTARDIRKAIKGTDAYGKERKDLLSWLCLRFRGFMMAAPDGFRVPSMPNTEQFLMVNSNHEREQDFMVQTGSLGASGVVFHGTQISRLLLILTEGLKVMSYTPFMMNGAGGGAGIYCGDDQATSFPFAGGTGRSWKNSKLGNRRVLLGCELAGYTTPTQWNAHVVANEERILVRYIFLVPQTFTSPPRHHVEPAMSIAFATLRSGLLT